MSLVLNSGWLFLLALLLLAAFSPRSRTSSIAVFSGMLFLSGLALPLSLSENIEQTFWLPIQSKRSELFLLFGLTGTLSVFLTFTSRVRFDLPLTSIAYIACATQWTLYKAGGHKRIYGTRNATDYRRPYVGCASRSKISSTSYTSVYPSGSVKTTGPFLFQSSKRRQCCGKAKGSSTRKQQGQWPLGRTTAFEHAFWTRHARTQTHA